MKKQKPIKKMLLQQIHPKIAVPILIIVVLALTGIYLYAGSIKNSQTNTPYQVTSPTSTVMPTKPKTASWHINNTQQWAIYSNPDAPFTMQYPPQWGYFEQTTLNDGGTVKTVPVTGVLFEQTPVQDYTYNIYVVWGDVGGTSNCIAQPLVQLKNEKILACEYLNDKGEDMMSMTPKSSSNLVIRTVATKTVTKEQILKILSTLSFTK